MSYLFEASVGGGIPIIRPLNQCLAANEITEICGILNGTTNYILTRMIRAGLSFAAALKEAQETAMPSRIPPPISKGTTPAAKSASWLRWPLDATCIPIRCLPRVSPA